MKARKWICALLALVIILGIMGYVPVQAASHDDVKTETQTTQIVDSEIEINEQYAQQEAFMIAAEEQGLFRYIDEDQFRNAKHVARLMEEETLDTYVFQNSDGTKSVYYMEADVKYIATDGSIRNKDISLVSVADGYTMRENDVQLLLPREAADGISVSHSGYNVQLIPQGGEGTAVLGDNSIAYKDYYGEGTLLRYTPTLFGVKEDIILAAYTGINSFQFVLETDGLYLYESENRYYLAESEYEEVAFYLGQIVVYDAMGCPSAGTMTVETVTEGQAYLLTVSADVDFLTAPTTVYPVTIDPTITVKDTMAGGVIIDAPIFSGYPNMNFGGFLYNKIGYCDEAYGIGRVVVKLNGLLDNEMFQAMDPEYIEKVEFYAMDDGSGYTNINLHPLTENSTWTESSITWNNVGAYGPVVDTKQMGHTNWTAFDITALAKQWKSGEQNGQCGFILIGTEEETKRMTLRSCEYGTGDYWPYVKVDYSLNLPLNCYSKDILVNHSFTLVAYGENGEALEDVTWTSSNSNIATVSTTGLVRGLRAGVATITASNSEGYSEPCTVYVRIQDGLYYIKNASSGLCLQATGSSVSIDRQKTNQEDRISQLWEIKYTSNGQYKIYGIQDLSVAMDANLAEYVTLTNVQEAGSWGIIENEFGYAIQYGGSSSDNAKPVVSGMPGSQVYLGAWESNLNCHWELEKAYGLFFREINSKKLVDSNNPIIIDPGENYSLTSLGIELEKHGSVVGGTTWSSSDRTVADVSYGEIDAYTNGGTVEISVAASLNMYACSSKFLLTVNKNAIIIVPGILGSELVLTEDVTLSLNNMVTLEAGTALWSDSLLNGDLNEVASIARLYLLTCDENGNSNYSVEPRNNQYGVRDTYEELYTSLEAKYEKNYLIEFFAYDWRLSNQLSAARLNDFIIENDYDRVVLVCHSMGGLVASGYLALGEDQRAKIETVIMLGSPLLGTSKMPYVWGQDDNTCLQMLEGFSLPDRLVPLLNVIGPLDALLGNLPSIYELFPTKASFDGIYGSHPYLTLAGPVNGNIVSLHMESYDQTREVFENTLNYYNETLADAAEIFHESLFQESEHITAKVNSYYIAGYGLSTTDSLTCMMDGSIQWTNDENEIEGDEVVSVWSATLGDHYMGRTFFAKNILHEDLVNNSSVLWFIIELISGDTTAINSVVTPGMNIND